MGTAGLSIIVPDGYQQFFSAPVFRRGTDSSINIAETPVSFYSMRATLSRNIDAVQAQVSPGRKILYHKQFRFNNYDAMIVCVADRVKQQAALYMTFGNENMDISMRGICRADDDTAIREMLNTFLTACYQPQA